MMTTPAPPVGRPMPGWLLGVIVGAFGLVFAYAVWNAIGNLVASVQAAAGAGVSLNALGWFLWIFAAVFPIVVFAAAFRLARRRVAWQILLIMLAGLSLVAVFWLDVVSYTELNTKLLIVS